MRRQTRERGPSFVRTGVLAVKTKMRDLAGLMFTIVVFVGVLHLFLVFVPDAHALTVTFHDRTEDLAVLIDGVPPPPGDVLLLRPASALTRVVTSFPSLVVAVPSGFLRA